MLTFTVVLLIRTPVHRSFVEWLLFLYVFAFGCEYLRKVCVSLTLMSFFQFLMSEMEPLSLKIRYFLFDFWNSVTIMAILMFYIGFLMRLCRFSVILFFTSSSSNETRANGRVVLACDSVLWTMKLLDYMSVHPMVCSSETVFIRTAWTIHHDGRENGPKYGVHCGNVDSLPPWIWIGSTVDHLPEWRLALDSRQKHIL